MTLEARTDQHNAAARERKERYTTHEHSKEVFFKLNFETMKMFSRIIFEAQR